MNVVNHKECGLVEGIVVALAIIPLFYYSLFHFVLHEHVSDCSFRAISRFAQRVATSDQLSSPT